MNKDKYNRQRIIQACVIGDISEFDYFRKKINFYSGRDYFILTLRHANMKMSEHILSITENKKKLVSNLNWNDLRRCKSGKLIEYFNSINQKDTPELFKVKDILFTQIFINLWERGYVEETFWMIDKFDNQKKLSCCNMLIRENNYRAKKNKSLLISYIRDLSIENILND